MVPSGERLRGKGRHRVPCRLNLWSMPERIKVVCIPCKALYKCSALPFLPLSTFLNFSLNQIRLRNFIFVLVVFCVFQIFYIVQYSYFNFPWIAVDYCCRGFNGPERQITYRVWNELWQSKIKGPSWHHLDILLTFTNPRLKSCTVVENCINRCLRCLVFTPRIPLVYTLRVYVLERIHEYHALTFPGL